jgi:hypothetical protein
MDVSDAATRQEEMMRDLSLLRAARHEPALPDTGECYWCSDGVPPGHRFCDKECRDMFEKAQRIAKINGKVVA